MIEAWLSSSEMIASSAPSSVSNSAAVGVEAGGVEDRVLGAEERGEPRAPAPCAASCVPQMKRTDGHPEAPLVERLAARRRRIARVVGEAEVVVGAEVEHRRCAVGRRSRARPAAVVITRSRLVQARRSRIVVERRRASWLAFDVRRTSVAQLSRASRGRPCRRRPDRAASRTPPRSSAYGKRWVITRRDVAARDCEHHRHRVPGLVHLPAVDALDREHVE